MAPAYGGTASRSGSSHPRSNVDPFQKATSASRSRDPVRAQKPSDSAVKKRPQSQEVSSVIRNRPRDRSAARLTPSVSNLTVVEHPTGTRDLNLHTNGRENQKHDHERKLRVRPQVSKTANGPVKAFPLRGTANSHSIVPVDSPLDTPEPLNDNEIPKDLNGNSLRTKSPKQQATQKKSNTLSRHSNSMLNISTCEPPPRPLPELKRISQEPHLPVRNRKTCSSQATVGKTRKFVAHADQDQGTDDIGKSTDKLSLDNRSKHSSAYNNGDLGPDEGLHGRNRRFVQAERKGEVLGGRSPLEEVTTHSVDQNGLDVPKTRRASCSSVNSNGGKTKDYRTETFIINAGRNSEDRGNGDLTADLPGDTTVECSELNISGKAGVVGLKNLGNTCFMNSVLQCLSNTQPLLNYCLNKHYKNDINKSSSLLKGKMMKVFAELMSDLWTGTQQYLSPRDFKSEISNFAKQFVGYREQDAHEFLVYLLEALHEDVNRVKEKRKRIVDEADDTATTSTSDQASISWQRYLECDNSQITDIFVGQLKSTLTCLDCHHVSDTFEPFLALSLPLKKTRSRMLLEDCFRLFSQKEVLDKENQPMCANCREQKTCSKQMAIHRFPKVLIIHLMRFKQGSSVKLTTELVCSLKDLDLSEFATPESQLDYPPIYDLYAVSNHSGSLYSGHYASYAKNPFSQQWYSFNDRHVSSLNLSKLESGQPYLLFYERREQLTTRC